MSPAQPPTDKSGATGVILPVPLGDTIGGKYRLERVLGSSGMGVVYLATNLQMDAKVAVKFLLAKAGDDQDALIRFEREAKFTAKIQNEHVVRILDVGHVSAGFPFIVMEHLEGHDLGREIQMRGRLPVATAVDYLLQACEGLQAAHEAGIVHRDVKPSNLFVAKMPDGRTVVKVIDFGVAKFRGNGSTAEANADSLTSTSVIVGSPRYMAPEQVRASKDVDARADVWALGIILQELLTAQPVFRAPTISDSIVMILTTEPPSMSLLRPDLPPALCDAVWRALRKDPAQRYRSVAAFAHDIMPFASETRRLLVTEIFRKDSVPAPPVSFSASLADTSGPTTVMPMDAVTRTAWDTDPKPVRRTPKLAIAGALLVFLGLASGGAYVARSKFVHAVAPAPTSTIAVSNAPRATDSASMVSVPIVRQAAPTSGASDPVTPAASAPPQAASAKPPQTQQQAAGVAPRPQRPGGAAPPPKSSVHAPEPTAPPAQPQPPPTATATEPKPSLFDEPK